MSLTSQELRHLYRHKNLTKIPKDQERLLDASSEQHAAFEVLLPQKVLDGVIEHHQRKRKAAEQTDLVQQSTKRTKIAAGPARQQTKESEEAGSDSSQGTPTSWSPSPPPQKNETPPRGALGSVESSPTRSPDELRAPRRSKAQASPEDEGATSELDDMDTEIPQALDRVESMNKSSRSQQTASSAERFPTPQQTPTCAQPPAIVPSTIEEKVNHSSHSNSKIRLKPFPDIHSPAQPRSSSIRANTSLRKVWSLEPDMTSSPAAGSIAEPSSPAAELSDSLRAETDKAEALHGLNASHRDLVQVQHAPIAGDVGRNMQRLDLDPYETFVRQYPQYVKTYSGSLMHFLKACLCLDHMRKRRSLRDSNWDELIRAFSCGYVPYISQLAEDEENSSTKLTLVEWFSELTGPNIFNEGLITRQTLDYVFQRYPAQTASIRAEIGNKRRHAPATPSMDNLLDKGRVHRRSYSINSNATSPESFHGQHASTRTPSTTSKRRQPPASTVTRPSPTERKEQMNSRRSEDRVVEVAVMNSTPGPVSPQLGSDEVIVPASVPDTSVRKARRSSYFQKLVGSQTPRKHSGEEARLARLKEHIKRKSLNATRGAG